MKASRSKILMIIAIPTLIALFLTAGYISASAAQSGAVSIELTGDSAQSDSSNVSIDGSTVTIQASGTYSVSGSLSDGQLVVDSGKGNSVTLILDGVSIHNEDGSPLAILSGKLVEIVLNDGTENTLSDGATYVFPDAATDEPNATLYSKSDLVLSGNGTLQIAARYNDGIGAKDTLTIQSGTYIITAADDGIRGKDSLTIEGGTFTVTAGGDALKSDNDTDTTLGWIQINNGTFDLTASGDGIAAETNVVIQNGTFNIKTGGGYQVAASDDLSAKGIKAGVLVQIDGGTFTVDSSDDTVHSNGSIVINQGSLTLSSGDDAIHAEATLDINAGTITILACYEGLEAADININDGSVTITSYDDSINISSGESASAGGWGGFPGGGSSSGGKLTINGGNVFITTSRGDSLDANGSIEINGGLILINGTTANDNAALDADGSFVINGGEIVVVGSSGMAMAPNTSSKQNSATITLSGGSAGSPINISDSNGNSLMTFVPTTNWSTLTYSSAQLKTGETYTISIGGTVSGSEVFGYYADGSYSGGTVAGTFTQSSVVTTVGGAGGGRGGFPGGGGFQGGGPGGGPGGGGFPGGGPGRR